MESNPYVYNQIREKTKENKDLEKQLASANNRIEMLEKQLTDAKNQIIIFKDKLEMLQSRLESMIYTGAIQYYSDVKK